MICLFASLVVLLQDAGFNQFVNQLLHRIEGRQKACCGMTIRTSDSATIPPFLHLAAMSQNQSAPSVREMDLHNAVGKYFFLCQYCFLFYFRFHIPTIECHELYIILHDFKSFLRQIQLHAQAKLRMAEPAVFVGGQFVRRIERLEQFVVAFTELQRITGDVRLVFLCAE